MSRHANHAWILTSSAERDLHTCAGCQMTVEVPRGKKPSAACARRVNGEPYPARFAVPACSSPRQKRPEVHGKLQGDRVYLTANKEWRDMLGLCFEVCGKQRVKDYLRLRGVELTEEQELAIVSLHAAVRVYVLDAQPELELVSKWARARRRDDLAGLAEGHGGEQHAGYEGARRVPAAGGAM